MAALDFPNSPAVNDTYTSGSQTWKWNGITWDLITGTVVNTVAGTTDQILVNGATAAVSGNATLSLPTNVAMVGDISFPNTTNVGIKNVAGTSYIHLDRTTGNSQWLTKATAQAYIDADTFNVRSNGGTSRLVISSTGINAPVVINSTLGSGAPITVTSTTVCTNLNADLLDGKQGNTYMYTATTGQIIVAGSFTSAAFSNVAGSTASGTFNFGYTFASAPTLILSCTALTGNTNTWINVGTTLSTTQGSYRAAISGTSNSTVTVHWMAVGTAA